jgi:hypothetical protein
LERVSFFPTYHTIYENAKLVENIMDKGFDIFRLTTHIIGEYIRRLSGALILPYNSTTYACELQKEFKLFSSEYSSFFSELNIKLDYLNQSIEIFYSESVKFHSRLAKIDKSE